MEKGPQKFQLYFLHKYQAVLIQIYHYGHIPLSLSTVNRIYQFSRVTRITPFCRYKKHSTGPITCWLWVRTYSKFGSSESAFTVQNDWVQSNAIHTFGRESRSSFERIRRFGLLYLQTGEYGQYQSWSTCREKILWCENRWLSAAGSAAEDAYIFLHQSIFFNLVYEILKSRPLEIFFHSF